MLSPAEHKMGSEKLVVAPKEKKVSIFYIYTTVNPISAMMIS